MAQLDVLEDAAVWIGDDGRIHAVGPYPSLRKHAAATEVVEVDGVLFPGFVDAHTHAVFGGPRLEDHERRARGINYQEIAAAGGGILQSVRDLRGRSGEELRDLTARRLETLLQLGTTTVEVKSGYGLTVEDELKQLDVVRALRGRPPRLVATFLGAHEVPEEHRSDPERYVQLVLEEMLPAVARHGLARFCDVFCEPGVFSVDQSRRILDAARRYGLAVKVHADELDGSGGAELAVAAGAISADHLAAVSDRGVAALAGSRTVAVLLPGTMLFLGKRHQAPARRLMDAGAAVALATDFNPGSSPGMSLPLMAMLGISQMGMLPAEAITAITVNGAAALGEAGVAGQIAPGFRADLLLLGVRDWREVPYWYGANLVRGTWVGGAACHPGAAALHFLV